MSEALEAERTGRRNRLGERHLTSEEAITSVGFMVMMLPFTLFPSPFPSRFSTRHVPTYPHLTTSPSVRFAPQGPPSAPHEGRGRWEVVREWVNVGKRISLPPLSLLHHSPVLSSGYQWFPLPYPTSLGSHLMSFTRYAVHSWGDVGAEMREATWGEKSREAEIIRKVDSFRPGFSHHLHLTPGPLLTHFVHSSWSPEGVRWAERTEPDRRGPDQSEWGEVRVGWERGMRQGHETTLGFYKLLEAAITRK